MLCNPISLEVDLDQEQAKKNEGASIFTRSIQQIWLLLFMGLPQENFHILEAVRTYYFIFISFAKKLSCYF